MLLVPHTDELLPGDSWLVPEIDFPPPRQSFAIKPAESLQEPPRNPTRSCVWFRTELACKVSCDGNARFLLLINITEATLMKRFGFISTAFLFLLMGITASISAQDDREKPQAQPAAHDEKANPPEEKRAPEAKPAQDEEKRTQQDEKQDDKKAQNDEKREQKNDKQENAKQENEKQVQDQQKQQQKDEKRAQQDDKNHPQVRPTQEDRKSVV